MKVLVSGAGIGGLAAARALVADGHQVTVFEQAPELRHGGAAVTLWSNGTGVIDALGVPVKGAGAPIDVMETRDRRGRLLLSVDVARSAAHYGHPHVCLPRARLLDLLAAGLPPGTVTFGRTATGAVEGTGAVEETRAVEATGAARPTGVVEEPGAAAAYAAGVTLTFADGGSAHGDLLVAADGRGSAIRNQLWGADPGQFTGWATWQGLSPVPSAITAGRGSVLFVGKPGTCGLMPAGDGLLQWWFDLRWTPGTPPPAAPVAMLRERFGDWAPPVRQVLDAVTDDETGFFPHVRHRVPRTWGSGRVTVIGDAAHSMPPTRAQGANQALEDAWVLGRALRGAADPVAALRSFEQARSRKVSVVARQAGSEDYNRYGASLSRLVPAALASRYYTHWLRQISTYLDDAPYRA
jgi:FAD-dependent urate hydroxylase